MDMDECRKVLLNKALQISAPDAQRFVDYVVNHRLPADIRQYSSGSIQQVRSLFHEVMPYLEACPPQFQQLPLQQPPSWGHGLQFPPPPPPPPPQPQLHPSSSFPGNQAQFPLPHGQPQFDPRFIFNRIQLPLLPLGEIGQALPQFHPSTISKGTQAFIPNVDSNALKGVHQFRPSTISKGTQAFIPNVDSNALKGVPPNVHSNALKGAHQNSSQGVTGDSPRRSKHKRCYDHFTGGCKIRENCHNCHWHYIDGMEHEIPNHSLETLPMLGEEIRRLLISQQSSVVPIEHLPMIYFEKYGKSLLVKDIIPEGQRLGGRGSYSLICLLMRLDTIKVIESDGQRCVALGGDAPGSSGLAADSKLVLAPPNPGRRVRIYIAFCHQSTFTVTDAWNYFRKFGPVTFLQILPQRTGATSGYVSFIYPETVELLLSEKRSNCHLICGAQVQIFSSMEKLESMISGQEEDDKMSDVMVSYEHHTGEISSSKLEPCRKKLNNECHVVIITDRSSSTVDPVIASEGDSALGSSGVSNRLDKASEDQDIDESELQDDLAVG